MTQPPAPCNPTPAPPATPTCHPPPQFDSVFWDPEVDYFGCPRPGGADGRGRCFTFWNLARCAALKEEGGCGTAGAGWEQGGGGGAGLGLLHAFSPRPPRARARRARRFNGGVPLLAALVSGRAAHASEKAGEDEMRDAALEVGLEGGLAVLWVSRPHLWQ
jgi:hypothetical protein